MHFTYIQILRFFAATSVLLFHSIGSGERYLTGQETILFGAFRHGDVGVDLFFVISGFIIYYSSYQTPISPTQFLRKRIERIVPLYWLVTGAFFLLAISFPRLFNELESINARHLIKSLFYISFTDDQAPLVYVGWSLEFEMFFYLTVVQLLFFCNNVWDRLVLILCTLTMLGCSDTVLQTLGNYKFFVSPLMLEFAFGVLAGKLIARQKIPTGIWVAAILATIVLQAVDSTSRVIVAGLPSVVLVLAATKLSRIRTTPSWFEKMLGILGDASYSIYLIQVFVISAACKLIVKFLPSIPLDILIPMSTATAVLAGYVVYILAERPMLNLCRRIRPRVH